MKLSSYFVLSTAALVFNVVYVWSNYQQFYPTLIYIASDKISVTIAYNFVFASFLMLVFLFLRIFIGTLRDLELESLIDSGRGFLADTILFLVFYSPTIDQREVGTLQTMQFILSLVTLKTFHLIAQIRVNHMFEIGIPKFSVHVKFSALLGILFIVDILVVRHFYVLAGQHSTFYTWILFEAVNMLFSLFYASIKYAMHLIDVNLENGWPSKAVNVFYVELMGDVTNMINFLTFMAVFFVQNPSRLPIYMMADILQVARQLHLRLKNFKRYREILHNFDALPSPSAKDVENAATCIICRDDLEVENSLQLSCNHIFHKDCLKSWLIMQQVCPTCRAPINVEEMLQKKKRLDSLEKMKKNECIPIEEEDGLGTGTNHEDKKVEQNVQTGAADQLLASPDNNNTINKQADPASHSGFTEIPHQTVRSDASFVSASVGTNQQNNINRQSQTAASPSLVTSTARHPSNNLHTSPPHASAQQTPLLQNNQRASGSSKPPSKAASFVGSPAQTAASPEMQANIQELNQAMEHASKTVNFLRDMQSFWLNEVVRLSSQPPTNANNTNVDLASPIPPLSPTINNAASPDIPIMQRERPTAPTPAPFEMPTDPHSYSRPSRASDNLQVAEQIAAPTFSEVGVDDPPKLKTENTSSASPLADLKELQKERWRKQKEQQD